MEQNDNALVLLLEMFVRWRNGETVPGLNVPVMLIGLLKLVEGDQADVSAERVETIMQSPETFSDVLDPIEEALTDAAAMSVWASDFVPTVT